MGQLLIVSSQIYWTQECKNCIEIIHSEGKDVKSVFKKYTKFQKNLLEKFEKAI